MAPAEFEEILDAIGRYDVFGSYSHPEHLTAIGETARGRELRIVFDLDETDEFVLVRPITAYDPDHE